MPERGWMDRLVDNDDTQGLADIFAIIKDYWKQMGKDSIDIATMNIL